MPRDTLTRDQIVRTAVALLDDEGLEGLNMRALGKRLDSAATAVYWHVKSKDNLVLLATDRVWGELTLPDPDTVGWRAAATAMAADLYRMFTRHPWLVQVFAAHLVYGESKARHDEHQLAVYEAGGFTGADADRAAAAVFTYVLGNAAGVAATASLTRGLDRNGGGAREHVDAAMAQAREIAERFPRLRARLDTAAATGYAASPDQTFEFGLQALLDGLERSTSHPE
ncbi:TetR/AcrR family transcriptional regulator C-terminal domain-containing protein [Actinomadura sp. NPDC049382]|uniref:TetR/AcrR family transcriptional regulator n=1 Tax=Actinomadura sp. NPDC049382 TaxID=3158220 RepID=UPI003433C287